MTYLIDTHAHLDMVENIDEVIYSISDKMLEKYAAAVRRLYSDGNQAFKEWI